VPDPARTAANPGLEIPVRPRTVAFALALCIGALTAANLFAALLVHGFDVNDRLGILRLFDFNAEANIPTLYQSVALLTCAALLFVIAAAKRREHDEFRVYWLILALAFLYLGLDEGSEIHELATAPARLLVAPVGVFRLTWVALAIPVAALFGFAFLRFLLRLPPFFRNAFFVCGGLYAGGALGVEMLGGLYLDATDRYDGRYALITTVEELLEKTAVAAFLVTLLVYLRERVQSVRISLT
jgi:hypothetical protein